MDPVPLTGGETEIMTVHTRPNKAKRKEYGSCPDVAKATRLAELR